MPLANKVLSVGSTAPDFLLRDAVRGGNCSLADLVANGPLILKFQRGTWCPSCRRELKATRRSYEKDQGVASNVAFILCQKPYDAVSYFAKDPERDSYPFPVLVDARRTVARAYGVYVFFNFESIRIARPATFVIGTDRKILYLYVGSRQRDWPPTEAVFKQVPSL